MEKLYEELKKQYQYDTFVVKFRLKYKHEENYRTRVSVVFHDALSDSWVWLDDWNEGEDDIIVVRYVPLEELLEDNGFY